MHYGLTGLATLMLPTSIPLVFTFYGSDINNRVQRTIDPDEIERNAAVDLARRAASRHFESGRVDAPHLFL